MDKAQLSKPHKTSIESRAMCGVHWVLMNFRNWPLPVIGPWHQKVMIANFETVTAMLAKPLALISMLLFFDPATAHILSPRAYGDIQFGARLTDVEARLKESAVPRNHEFGCDFVQFEKYPGVHFMVEDGIVTRADVAPNIPNSSGVRIGTRLSEVKRRFPEVKVEPHKYDEHGHYLSLPTKDGKAALLFEEVDGRVTDVRAGLFPSVAYVEGCL